LAAGVIAEAALLIARMRREPTVRILFALALFSSLTSSGLMGQVAHLGGQIGHEEIQPQAAADESHRLSHAGRGQLRWDDD
jgi:hypothetical protein